MCFAQTSSSASFIDDKTLVALSVHLNLLFAKCIAALISIYMFLPFWTLKFIDYCDVYVFFVLPSRFYLIFMGHYCFSLLLGGVGSSILISFIVFVVAHSKQIRRHVRTKQTENQTLEVAVQQRRFHLQPILFEFEKNRGRVEIGWTWGSHN